MPRLTLALFTALAASLVFTSCRSDRGSGTPGPTHAVVELVPVGDSGVSGTLGLEVVADGVRITGTVSGLEPGRHGFHVHEHGDLSDRAEGKSAGGHFAPRGHDHGRPAADHRHVGDLGNIVADEAGLAVVDITDDVIALSGDHSILGRSIVVHAKADTYGQPTGDAGARVAFGVIESVGRR